MAVTLGYTHDKRMRLERERGGMTAAHDLGRTSIPTPRLVFEKKLFLYMHRGVVLFLSSFLLGPWNTESNFLFFFLITPHTHTLVLEFVFPIPN